MKSLDKNNRLIINLTEKEVTSIYKDLFNNGFINYKEESLAMFTFRRLLREFIQNRAEIIPQLDDIETENKE